MQSWSSGSGRAERSCWWVRENGAGACGCGLGLGQGTERSLKPLGSGAELLWIKVWALLWCVDVQRQWKLLREWQYEIWANQVTSGPELPVLRGLDQLCVAQPAPCAHALQRLPALTQGLKTPNHLPKNHQNPTKMPQSRGWCRLVMRMCFSSKQYQIWNLSTGVLYLDDKSQRLLSAYGFATKNQGILNDEIKLSRK